MKYPILVWTIRFLDICIIFAEAITFVELLNKNFRRESSLEIGNK